MKYRNMVKGTFIERPNRFVAVCRIGGKAQKVHVKNTGRCRELLVPGADVWLEDFAGRMGERKLRYSLITVRKGERLINMDSQAPNQVVAEGLAEGRIRLPGMERLCEIQREKTLGNSRIDFRVTDEAGQVCWVEVKGVTLEDAGICRFPDAPTVRGTRHLRELTEVVATQREDGNRRGSLAAVLFVIQMQGIQAFCPNDATDPDFGKALRQAKEAGVEILAYDCSVSPDRMEIGTPIPIQIA